MNPSEEQFYGKQNAAYDQAAKKVLSQRRILSFILKRLVVEFRDVPIHEIETKYIEGMPQIGVVPVHPDRTNPTIRGANTEDGSISEGMVRYDILFEAVTPETKQPIMLIINIEAQNDANPGYELLKRAFYYGSRLISSQRGRDFQGDDYNSIKKVYTIWICMHASKGMGNTINRYALSEKHLHGKYRADPVVYDLMNIVMLYLGDHKTQDRLMELLRIVFKENSSAEDKKARLAAEYDIRLTEDETKELRTMCNLSEGLYHNGYENGYDTGYDSGYRTGSEHTREEEQIRSLRNVMSSLQISLEAAMKILKFPAEKTDYYRKALETGDFQ